MSTHTPLSAGTSRHATRIAVGCAIAATILASIVPVASARTAAPQSLTNGSFSNGLAHWTAVGSSAPCPWSVIRAFTTDMVCHAGYGFQEPAPVDGTTFASTDFDRPTAADPADATLSQTLRIPHGGAATLRWSDFISWDLATYGATLPRVASVEIRNESGTKILSTLSQQTLLPGTASLDTHAWTAHAADVSRFAGRTVTLVFHLSMPEVATGPATYSVDAVRIDTN